MPSGQPSALRRLVTYAWRAPVMSLPFALFFGTLAGADARSYRLSYQLALVFSTIISVAIWAVEVWLVPAVRRRFGGTLSALSEGALYMSAAVAASVVAGVVVQATMFPQFLGNPRSAALFGMFSLLFAGLFTAAALVVHYHKSSLEHARSEKELELARAIQRSFLPEHFPAAGSVEIHAVNVPSRHVSGDFYDVVATDAGLVLAIADVEGKSIPAALLVSALQASLRTQTPAATSISGIVAAINALACQRAGLQQFATFFLARIDAEGRHLTYCNAGHNPPVLFRAGGGQRLLDRGGIMFGVLEAAPFDEETLDLQPGDRAVFYTDGVTETLSPGGEEFGTERLTSLVQALPPDVSARAVTERLLRELDVFSAGADPADDRTLLVLRVVA